MLRIENNESPSRSISILAEDGQRKELVHVSCSMRPGGVYLNIDIQDAALTAEHSDEVNAELTSFAREAFVRAASMGLPVPSVGGVADA